MSDEILKVIERCSVVLRILNALSWDTYNLREVSPEYSVENKWVDYALLIGNTPQVFIEVKKGGEPLEKHQEQLLNYAFRQGVKIAILTNGVIWWFYLPLRGGSWKQRKFDAVELNNQDKEDITRNFLNFLSKENISSGNAVQNAEDLYERNEKKEEISTTLPKAWNQLVSEPDDLLVELLADKTNELCGHKPHENEVEQFMSAHLQNIRVTSPPVAVEPIPTPEPKPSDRRKGKKRKAFTVTKPTAFTFKREPYEVKSWKEMLVRLCEILYTAHEDQFEKKVLEMKSPRGLPYFSKNPDTLKNARMISGTVIYVGTGTRGSRSAPKFAKNLIVHFGYDENDLLFEDIE